MNYIPVKNSKELILQNSEEWKVFVSATIDFDGLPVKIGIAHGLGNARKLLDDVRSGKSQFHAIEVMACPGGCIGGGGQPLAPWKFGNHKSKSSCTIRGRQKKTTQKIT